MAVGSEGWVPGDELDLGPDDDNPNRYDDETSSNPQSLVRQSLSHKFGDVDASDQVSEASAQRLDEADLPQTPPRRIIGSYGAITGPGNIDERASTPDDSPSLHVSDQRVALTRGPF